MAAPILSFTPTKSEIEKPKEPTFPPKNICCTVWPIPDSLNIQKILQRKKCPHCGATERLITGECAYCRQY